MAKTNPLGVRLQPEVKAALERAAKDDLRSLSSLIDKVLVEWLREHDYLARAQAEVAEQTPVRATKRRQAT